MSHRMRSWALGLLVLSVPACKKAADSTRSASPSLNPDAPPVTSDAHSRPLPDEEKSKVPEPQNTSAPRYYAYAGGGSDHIGIYQFEVPAGTLQLIRNVPLQGAVTSYMAFHPTSPWLYVTNESGNGGIMAFSINPDNGELTKLNEISANGGGPTHVSVDQSGRYVLTANYGTGQVQSFAIQNDGRLGQQMSRALAGQNAHQILNGPSGTAVYVPCLGANHIAQYSWSPQTGQLTPLTPPFLSLVNGGPRHMVFHPSNPWAYVLKELSSTIQAVRYEADTQQLSRLGPELSTRPVGGGNNSAAEVQIHPSGSFVYSSNRGDNTIALFAVNADGTLAYQSVTPTGGAIPRHFSILPDGKWLLAANQESGTITVFELNSETGSLTGRGQPTRFAAAQFVEAIDLNRYKNRNTR